MDSDSDAGSVVGKYSSAWHAFICSLSSQIFKRMKRYLDQNKRFYEYKGKNQYKIVLYEDILIIYRFKENEQWVFHRKKNLQQLISRLETELKRKCLKDRVRKKLAQLNQQQLMYLMDNNKSLVFRENTSVINTDDWPQHLKIINKPNKRVIVPSAPSEEENIINLDSSERSRSNRSQRSNMSHRSHRSHRSHTSQRSARRYSRKKKSDQSHVDQFKKKLQSKRKVQKTNVLINQIEKIMSESQGQQNQSKRKSIKIKEIESLFSPDQKIYDLQDPLEKEIFLGKVIEKWRSQHMDKTYFDSNKFLMQSKICYNFRSKGYKFLNPQVIRSVWNNLNRQCLINVIKSKSSNKKDKVDKLLSLEKNQNSRNYEKETQNKSRRNQFDDHYEQRQDNIMRCTKNMDNDQEQGSYTKKKPVYVDNQRQMLYSFQNPIIQVSEIQESNKKESYQKNQNDSQSSSQNNNMVKIKNPIKMLEEIASNCELDKVSEQMRELIIKGMKITQRLKRESGQQAQSQKDTMQNQKQKEKNDIWQEQEEQPERQRQSQLNSQQNHIDDSKPMIYWFNNDPDLYEIYQQSPYEMGHLLWTEQQDQILQKANRNLQEYFDDFECLINEKTPKYLISRIRFLKINPSVELYMIISKYLQQQSQ